MAKAKNGAVGKRTPKKTARNPGIGKKIAKLEKEGIKPKQAIATALSMAKAGRLTPGGGYKRVAKKGKR